jgi:GNAT superfamily N-acetyltransferase
MPASSDHRVALFRAADTLPLLEIINEAALAYRGVIPGDRWHDPYMSSDELRRDIERGVSFVGLSVGERLVGVMGVQQVRDCDLIRHAYVLPSFQRHGIGGTLLRHLMAGTTRRMLVGTWASAAWAVAFYQRHGFTLADPVQSKLLLGAYWEIPPAQMEASVVLLRAATDEKSMYPRLTGPA